MRRTQAGYPREPSGTAHRSILRNPPFRKRRQPVRSPQQPQHNKEQSTLERATGNLMHARRITVQLDQDSSTFSCRSGKGGCRHPGTAAASQKNKIRSGTGTTAEMAISAERIRHAGMKQAIGVSASIPKAGKTRRNDVLAHERTFPRASILRFIATGTHRNTGPTLCTCAASTSPDRVTVGCFGSAW